MTFAQRVQKTKEHERFSRAPSTLNTYKSCLNTYEKYIKNSQKTDDTVPDPYPITEDLMRYYLDYIASKEPKVPFSTISQIRSSFSYYFNSNKMTNLTFNPAFQDYMKSLKRTHLAELYPNAKHFVDFELMEKLAMSADFMDEFETRETCMYFVLFFGFLRISEALALRECDVSYNDETGLWKINIRVSKTDKFGHGTEVYIGHNNTWASGHVWLLFCYAFANCDLERPLFPWSKKEVYKMLKRRLKKLGYDEETRYSTHSFRKGGAHEAYLRGIQDCVIKSHGRWKSVAYQRYTSVLRQDAGKSITSIMGSQE